MFIDHCVAENNEVRLYDSIGTIGEDWNMSEAVNLHSVTIPLYQTTDSDKCDNQLPLIRSFSSHLR